MGRANLYREGARLPEQLARLLFLEPVLQGRRVLEVGATSDSVARFLLELGASRVVCASADKVLVDTLRAECQLEHVDFRVIRPGVLPGDDGAFDLVIDFTLAEALAAGETFRLTDIGRLLSRDGFAVSAIESHAVRGIGALLGEAPSIPAVASSRSAAGLSGAPGPVGYRQLLDALKLQFELVQVYFQSLVLGYLFGSFDVEPTGDGVSPATALMGHEPEPAGHYLFAFGNAVPVIEDVALIQVPFSDLLTRIGKGPVDADATITPTPIAPHAEEPPAPRAAGDDARAPALDDEEVRTLRREHAAQAQALTHIAVRTEELRTEVTQLLTALDVRTRERDELGAFVEGLQAALAARDAELAEARAQLGALDADGARLAEQARALAHEVEHAARAQLEELAQRVAALQTERGELVDHIAQLEGELAAMAARQRALDDARTHGDGHVHELEQALVRAEHERAALAEALEDLARTRDAERTHGAQQRQALEDAARAQSDEIVTLRSALDELSRVRSEETGALRSQLDEAREVAIALRAESEARAEELKRLKVVDDRARMLEEELAETRSLALKAQTEAIGKEELKAREEELSAALLKADARVRELEAEALKLAEGVKVLVAEREEARARLDKETARLHGLLDAERDNTRAQLADLSQRKAESDATLRTTAEELRSAQERVEALLRDAEGKDKRLKAAHAALEEARRDLVGAREGLQEVAGQRDTLQQVLRARERELEAARTQLLDAAGEARRLEEQLDAQGKALAEARDRLAAAELERVQATRRADDQGARALEREQDLAALRTQLDTQRAEAERVHAQLETANRRLLAAEEEGMSLLARLEDEERARAQTAAERDALAAQLTGERDALAAQLAQAERDFATRLLAEQGQVAATEDARRALADELVAARAALDDERARAQADALAQHEMVAGALGDAEARIARLESELQAHEQRRAMRDAEIESLRAVLDEAHATFDRERARSELLDATLLELQSALHGERARADLLRATLDEAQGALTRERASAALSRAQLEEAQHGLGLERARAELVRAHLEEAQHGLARERVGADLLRAHLEEAQRTLGRERANAELQREALHEARGMLDVERARGDLFSSELEEAQQHIVALRDRMRATLEHVQRRTEGERDTAAARADLQHELLLEAQQELAATTARVRLLEGELEDARATFHQRRTDLEDESAALRANAAAAQADLEELRGEIDTARARIASLEESVTRMGAVAAEKDAERQTLADTDAERIRALEDALAEEKQNAMLLQANVEKHEALADSATRERDAVLGDLTSHQARANAESARRQAVEEELAKLRVTHNQALADLQKLKLDAEADKRAAVPELESEIASLKARVETLDKAAEQREAKIAEQADLITRLKDRLVRIQDTH